MRARRVHSRRDLKAFIDLAPELAARRGDTDHYVPLFTSDIAQWHSHSGWFDEDVELWLIVDESGAPVARTICHSSPELAAKIAASDRPARATSDDEMPTNTTDTTDPAGEASLGRPSTLFFGALEAADAEALDHLIAHIGFRADQLGARRVFGPVSPLPNVTGGMLTAGTDRPGFFDTAWNPAFYADSFHAAGFASWGPAQTWEVEVGSIPAARATAVTEAEWEASGLRRRRISRFGLPAFARRLLPTLNAAFAQLPYYTQISTAQLKSQMQGLAALMDPELIIDIAGIKDSSETPSRCFVLVIPDPLPVLRRHGGRLGPSAILDLLVHRHELRDAVLIIQGTDPDFQGRGILSMAVRDLNSTLCAKGYRRLRVTFIAEDNPASAAVFERSGGEPMHSLSFFDRHLDGRRR